MSHRWRKAKKIRAEGSKQLLLCAEAGVTIEAAAGEKKIPTFKGCAYTGAAMTPMGWGDPVIVDLDGVEVPSQHRPALHAHDALAVVGHTTKVKVSQKAGIEVEGTFSGQTVHAEKVTDPASKGFEWQMSIGANPVSTEYLKAGATAKVNGRDITGPMVISRKTVLGEVSFVPLGADGETSAKVAAQKGNGIMENKWRLALKEHMAELLAAGGKKAKAAKYSDKDVDAMDEKQAKAALKESMNAQDDDDDDDDEPPPKKKKSDSSADVAGIQAAVKQAMLEGRQAAAKETRRLDGITAAVRKWGVTEMEVVEGGKKVTVNIAAHAIENDWTIEQTADKAEVVSLRAGRAGSNVGIPGGLGFSIANPELNEAVIEAAVMSTNRHQFQLEDDNFYFSDMPTVNGNSMRLRRVPEYIQRKIQGEMKARYTDQVRTAADRIFKGGCGLQKLIVACARLNGYTGSDRIDDSNGPEVLRFAAGSRLGGITDPGILAANGVSTASLANVLANVMNKFAGQGYLFTEQAWRETSAIRPVGDFKPTKTVNLLGDTKFQLVGDNGEIQDASLQDQAFANQADQYARILTIGRKSILNDDLGILTTTPMKIGQGAGLKLNDLYYTTFNNLSALLGDDGLAFFRSTSNLVAGSKQGTFYNLNLLTGAGSALSSASLQLAKQAFDKQVDPNGNPLGFDGLVPILFFPPELWMTAIELVDPSAIGLVYGGATAAKQPNINLWKGRLKPVMSRYLSNTTYTGASATAFFIMFAPTALPAMEVCFLNGVDTPTVQMAGEDFQFDRLGMSLRGVMDFGVNPQNFRGVVKSAGA